MRDLDDLLPEVLEQAPNCPDVLALKHLRDAAREFCSATRIWRDTDSFKVSSPECEGLSTTPDAEIFEIERADLDGRMLRPVTVGWLDANLPAWQSFPEQTGSARYVTQLNPNTVTVAPKAEGLLTLRVILQPSRTAETLPDFLVDQYAMHIGRGAAGNILLIQGKEWANPQLGAALIAGFTSFIGSKKIAVAKGQQGARLRTKASFF